MTIKRKLIYSERLMHMSDIKYCDPISITFSISVKGNIPFERVRITLDKLQKKHPALRAHVKGHHIFFEESGVPPIPVKIVERISEDTWKDEKEKFLQEPYNCDVGPLMKLLWVRSDEISEFVFNALHVIVNWKSCVLIIKEFFELLNNPDKEVKPYLPFKSLDELMQGESLTFKQKFLSVAYFCGMLSIQYIRASWNKKKIPLQLYNLSFRIPKEKTLKLNRIAEKNNVYIGSIICILALRVFKKHFHTERTSRLIHMSLDPRRYLPTVKKDMLHASAAVIFPKINIYDNADLWEQVQDFNTMLIDKTITMQKDENHPVYKNDRSRMFHSIRKNYLACEYLSYIIKPMVKFKVSVDEGLDFVYYNLGKPYPLPKNPEFEMNDIFSPEIKLPWYNSTIFGFGYDFDEKTIFTILSNEHFIPEEKMKIVQSDFREALEDLVKDEILSEI